MGGRGSGRFGYRGGRATTRAALRITIGGLLHGRLMRNVGVLFLTDERVRLNVWGCVVEVSITTTPHHHGGARRWFACPGCDHRRMVLYLHNGRLACRQCHGLIYASQLESHGSRKLRTKLHREWALIQFSRMLSGAQAGAVSGKVISEKN
jgi:hypothetical protein